MNDPSAGHRPLKAVFDDLSRQAEGLGRSSLALIRFDLECERDRLSRRLRRTTLLMLLGALSVQLLVMLLIAVAWNGEWRVPVIAALASAALLALASVLIGFRRRRAPVAAAASDWLEPSIGRRRE